MIWAPESFNDAPFYVQEVMWDPVTTADGFTYERAAIEAYLSRYQPPTQPLSPMTALPLPDTALLPNRLARDIIAHLGLLASK